MKRLSGIASLGLTALAAMHPNATMAVQKFENTTIQQELISYSDLADLALNAPIVAEAIIKKTNRLDEKISPGIPTGHARILVNAEVLRLISGSSAMPSNISYLIDVPLDSRGKLPKLKGSRIFLFLQTSAARPDMFALTTRFGQIPWTASTDQMIRTILTESNNGTDKFRITGIGNAFHVPGTVPGESETQIFLTTAEQRPVSLSILRRPGEASQWSVSLGEMVDEASRPAGRNTLLWYRLACFLPGQMPESVLAGTSEAERYAITMDYTFVLQQLGSCGRQFRPN